MMLLNANEFVNVKQGGFESNPSPTQESVPGSNIQKEIDGQNGKNVSGAFKGKSPMKKRGFGMKKPLYK